MTTALQKERPRAAQTPGGQVFASVWDAIEATPAEAANMRAKSTLLQGLQSWLAARPGTQKEAAQLLAVTQPRLSDLKRGRIDLFSLDTLMNMAAAAGLSPTIKLHAVSKPSKPTAPASVVQPVKAVPKYLAGTIKRRTPVAA